MHIDCALGQPYQPSQLRSIASPAKLLIHLDGLPLSALTWRRELFSSRDDRRTGCGLEHWPSIHYSGTMFARRISINRIGPDGAAHPCPIRQIDNFAMRNFTNDPAFDDTLPFADGLLEAGYRVPLDRLQTMMEDWFRRKGYLKPDERLAVIELNAQNPAAAPQAATSTAAPPHS